MAPTLDCRGYTARGDGQVRKSTACPSLQRTTTPTASVPHCSAFAALSPHKQVLACDQTIQNFGVLDYVHVVDLAKGHLAAMKKIDEKNSLQDPRREGDVDTMIADASKAGRELGWRGLED
ncbi:hypothetical protein ACOMHN_034116 [Nucella lapillus]